jgi:AP-4 complex subunit sigma-1
MPVQYVLLVNKQGQTRVSKYYKYVEIENRSALEGEIIRKCLARNNQQVR